MKDQLWKDHVSGISDPKTAFKQIVSFSKALENDFARRDYIRLLGMTLQNELLFRSILRS